MKPEAAIEMLTKQVLFRAQKGKNQEYTLALQDAVNSIIELYNREEKLRQEMHDLQEDYQTICSLYREASARVDLLIDVVHGRFVDNARMLRTSKIFVGMLEKQLYETEDPGREQLLLQQISEQQTLQQEYIRNINCLYLTHVKIFGEQEILSIFEEIHKIQSHE
ncbi:MAG: hypothetical protein KBS70_03445 [Bacteroidales bacterium]|nr:hypothetical protein [Candidatus Colicola equi]